MAEIIRPDQFGMSGIRCEPLGLFFPTVYRLTGVCWKLAGRVPDDRYPVTEYTLDKQPTTHIARTDFTPIDRLDPALDDGWVIVRHHADQSSIDGYLNGKHDLEDYPKWSRSVWKNRDGMFTVLHRKAVERCPNHLLIYAADVPPRSSARYNFGKECWTRIITSSGEVGKEDLLFPDDDDDVENGA